MKSKALFCILSLVGLPAFAADEVGSWYLTPEGGYLWTDDDRQTGNHSNYGFAFGKNVSENWSVEFNHNQADLGEGPLDLSFAATSLDTLRFFARDSAISPYITMGAGVLNIDPTRGAGEDKFMAQAGLGMLWRFGDHFALRPEAKARWNDDSGPAGDATDIIAMLGFQFTFGAPPPPPPPAPPPPAPEPAPAPPPPPPPPADTDGDGVTDDVDKCPGTAPGVAVDAVGCERKGSITLEGVNFEFNSADLMVDSRPALDRVAVDLKKYPRLKVEMQGHTDSVGADAYNQNLSQRRADSVAQFLTNAGVPTGQVTARGYGESEPVADNKTEEGRAQNRRVVMKVLENPRDVQVKGEGET